MPKSAKQQRSGLVKVILLSMIPILLGILILLYPFLSNYLLDRNSKAEYTTVQTEIEEMPDTETEAILEAAQRYNEALSQGQAKLVDPFIENEYAEDAGDYFELLNLTDSGVMGWVEIPKIDIYLPVYHGTSNTVLQSGIGHLEGSSLPIGGESTHAVLTGHTGLYNAKLFTDLNQLEEGDWFFFHVLNNTLAYQVTEIKIVLPEETESLYVRQDEDLMTLITCTPYGINDHRLLVTGTRGEYSEELEEQEIRKSYTTGSQWLTQYKEGLRIGLFCAVCLILLFVIIAIIRRRIRNNRLKR